MELVNVPVPVPSLVQLLPTTGFSIGLQQTPLAVTDAPPSEVMVPPLVAVVVVISETAVVDTTGGVTITVS